MSTYAVGRQIPEEESGLRRKAIGDELCEFCLDRKKQSVPAVVIIADSPMCAECFRGDRAGERTVSLIVNGKEVKGRVSAKWAKSYIEIEKLIQGECERVVIPCRFKDRAAMQSNMIRKAWRRGVRITSRATTHLVTFTRKGD